MRVMVLVKADENSESGAMPDPSMFEAMGAFNEQLVNAGVMLAADGLKPSSAGARVSFDDDGATTVLDGPFAETKELVGGYWIWQVSSMDEALEWLRRSPFRGTTVEVRPVWELDDFGAELSPELRQQEQELRDRIAGDAAG